MKTLTLLLLILGSSFLFQAKAVEGFVREIEQTANLLKELPTDEEIKACELDASELLSRESFYYNSWFLRQNIFNISNFDVVVYPLTINKYAFSRDFEYGVGGIVGQYFLSVNKFTLKNDVRAQYTNQICSKVYSKKIINCILTKSEKDEVLKQSIDRISLEITERIMKTDRMNTQGEHDKADIIVGHYFEKDNPIFKPIADSDDIEACINKFAQGISNYGAINSLQGINEEISNGHEIDGSGKKEKERTNSSTPSKEQTPNNLKAN